MFRCPLFVAARSILVVGMTAGFLGSNRIGVVLGIVLDAGRFLVLVVDNFVEVDMLVVATVFLELLVDVMLVVLRQ